MTEDWNAPRPSRAVAAGKWILMALGAIFLVAVLAGFNQAPGANDSQMEPYRDTREGTLTTDQLAYYGYEGASPLRLKVDHTTRVGTMSLYVMDFGEADHFMRGESFRHYPPSGENSITFRNAWDLPAGKYAVALKCNNAADPCPYTLHVEVSLR